MDPMKGTDLLPTTILSEQDFKLCLLKVSRFVLNCKSLLIEHMAHAINKMQNILEGHFVRLLKPCHQVLSKKLNPQLYQKGQVKTSGGQEIV